MPRRSRANALAWTLVCWSFFLGTVRSQTPTDKGATAEPRPESSRTTAKADKKPKPQTATFGGGCFWCTEAVFERVPGVQSVISGYSGGAVPNPTYQMVLSGLTGHAEAVQIVFDPTRVRYEQLVEIFWRTHDPSIPNVQGPDVGTQYRSVIFYHNEEQKRAAQKVYKDLRARRILRGVVVTELAPMNAFFPAEPYHQDYYANHPFEFYSQMYIAPKVDKLRKIKLKAEPKAEAEDGSEAEGKPAPKENGPDK